jgi:hypothetical protein
MFGGLYTNHISNVVTQQKNCPQYFHAIRIAEDLTICVSDDFENGFKYSIPLFVYKPPNIYPEEFNSASRAAHQYDW